MTGAQEMGGTEPASPGRRPDAEVVTPPRLAVIMDRPADASRVCRVDAPDRVLRIWAMLASASVELHQASLRPEAVARLQRQLDALVAELDRSLSPALAGELHHLVGRTAATELTADELRVEYATLLSWTIGLVIGILTELEQAGAKTIRAAARPQPATSRLWPSEARGTSEYPRMTKDSNPGVGNAVPRTWRRRGLLPRLAPGSVGRACARRTARPWPCPNRRRRRCRVRRLTGGRAGAGSRASPRAPRA
jgi:hypothetical protein